ncbi:hypothetical protein B0A50_01755 [Salinomyces thailandicus]|uniref:MJ1316 RNA cyclic group end recognition domain-containing protein n=1 Tax=Salinomyces thailandicus TaxID=706561 RepID=A0A4U0U9C3_9PEZI|nr:hypothetical protein B0A50_01755 [Salinomyces thailandica]
MSPAWFRIHPVMAPAMYPSRAAACITDIADKLHSTYIPLPLGDQSIASRTPVRWLFPTGTYAAHVWEQGAEDLHLVCMAEDSKKTFWSVVAEAYEIEQFQPPEDDIFLLPVKRIMGTESTRSPGSRIYLRRCPIPQTFDIATMAGYGVPFYDAEPSRTPHESENLAMIINAEFMTSRRSTLVRRANGWELFKHVYMRLAVWADQNGLLAPSVGYLSCESLLWSVFNIIDANTFQERLSSEDHYLQLYLQFCAIDLARMDKAEVKSPGGQDFARHMTPQGIQTFCLVAEEAFKRFLWNDKHGDKFPLRPDADSSAQGYNEFIATANQFFAITFESWSGDVYTREYLARRMTELRKIIASRLNARVWPTAVSRTATSVVYLLSSLPPRFRAATRNTQVPTKDSKSVLRDIENDLEYDRGACVVTLLEMSREDVQKAYPKQRNNVQGTEEIPVALDDVPAPQVSPSTRFRDASSVLARLRYDTKHTATAFEVGYLDQHVPTDFEIGYIDRFDGLKWIGLQDWGRETEEEDFIPQHRIRMVRRCKDDLVIWDREKRIDLTDETSNLGLEHVRISVETS